MRLYIVVLALAIGSTGCCWLAKRDCFPPCLPEKVVVVERPCDLPPIPPPPSIKTDDSKCPDDKICFDKEAAAKLAKYMAELKAWISDVVVRCSVPTSQPTSRPTE